MLRTCRLQVGDNVGIGGQLVVRRVSRAGYRFHRIVELAARNERFFPLGLQGVCEHTTGKQFDLIRRGATVGVLE